MVFSARIQYFHLNCIHLAGPKDEAWSDMFSRCYSGFCKMLLQPKRFVYSSADLQISTDDGNPIEVREFDVVEPSYRLHCAIWSVQPKTKICVIYIHTNTRSLMDAKEVLPVCTALGADLLGFDLPGCGKSEGALSFTMASDLGSIVTHARDVLGYMDVVVWARGMATAVAVEYSNGIKQDTTPLKFVVLDSPFVSVKRMVQDGSSSVKACGVTVPKVMISLSGKVIRRAVMSRLGCDPYDVIPLAHVSTITSPCYMLCATNDDYIPASHGVEMAEAWGQASGSEGGVLCVHCEFNGRHFGERLESLVLASVPVIEPYLTRREAEASGVASDPLTSPFSSLPTGMMRVKSNLALKGLC